MNPPSESSKHKASSKSSLNALTGQFGDAYSKLVQASHHAALQGQKQVEASHSHLAKAISDIQLDIRKRYVEAYQEYSNILQDAAIKQTGAQELQEAYQNFIDTVRGLEEDGLRRVDEANTEFMTKMQESASESEGKARENYLNYLRSLQQAWAGLDVNSLA